MSKELWIAAYEQLVEEYMEEGLTEAQAEILAEDGAQYRMRDNLADLGDYLHDIAKGN